MTDIQMWKFPWSIRWIKRWRQGSQDPLHMTVLMVDIVGFGDPRRSQYHREAMVDGLRAALESAFDRALKEVGKGWSDCVHEGEGDGMLILVSGDVSPNLMVRYFPNYLAAELRKYNESRSSEARIQLRAAIDSGPIPTVVTSDPVILAKRLVDADDHWTALEDPAKVLSLIASDKFYRETIRQDPSCNPKSYVEVPVNVKETVTTGWRYLA